MPELAEVEFFRKQWDPGLGQKVVTVQLHPRKRIFRGTDPRKIVESLPGRRFLRSYARGKRMLFKFTGGNWIGLHLGMTGKLRTEPAGFRPEKHDHFVLQQTRQALVFRDARLFGRVRFHQGKSEPAWWRLGGPEIASAQFDRHFLDAFLNRHSRAPIKAVVLMQDGFSGIGNWMADEILWRAGIEPSVRAGELSARHRARLLRETRFVASEALRVIGPAFADPPPDWLIHQKWKRAGVCPRHKSRLQKGTLGGRTTAWCPRCQKK